MPKLYRSYTKGNGKFPALFSYWYGPFGLFQHYRQSEEETNTEVCIGLLFLSFVRSWEGWSFRIGIGP